MTTHVKKNPPDGPVRVVGVVLLAGILTALAIPASPASANPPTPPTRIVAAAGSADAKFGTGVSISGNTAVAGAPDEGGTPEEGGGMGAAYVFTRTRGTWTEQTTLVAPVRTDGDKFGFSVSVDHDTVVVGAPSADELVKGPGVAYVYVRRGVTWAHQATLAPSDSKAGDAFGFDVALSRDTAVVGSLAGAAYVFTRSGDVWSEQAKLTGRDAATDGFGSSVAISDDTAVISAIDDDVAPGIDQGSAYVFTRTGSAWAEQARLVAADGLPRDAFADSVAVFRDTVVVGASFDDIGLNPKQGSAYVFVRNGTSWTQHAKLTAPAPDGDAGDMFGRSVATDGDVVVVGSHFDEDGGSVYVFNRFADAWRGPTRLTAAGAGLLGVSIGLWGHTVIGGANFTNVGDNGAQGAAYAFDLPHES